MIFEYSPDSKLDVPGAANSWPSFDPLLINNDQDPLLGLEQCDGQSEEGGQDLVHRLQWGLPVPAASG